MQKNGQLLCNAIRSIGYVRTKRSGDEGDHCISAAHCAKNKRSFLRVFLTFVPSLSWGIIVFHPRKLGRTGGGGGHFSPAAHACQSIGIGAFPPQLRTSQPRTRACRQTAAAWNGATCFASCSSCFFSCCFRSRTCSAVGSPLPSTSATARSPPPTPTPPMAAMAAALSAVDAAVVVAAGMGADQACISLQRLRTATRSASRRSSAATSASLATCTASASESLSTPVVASRCSAIRKHHSF
jgi:hypothetical protein